VRDRLPLLAVPLALLALLALAQPAAAEPVVVDVDLHVISFGNYDPHKGTYTLDTYLHLAYDAAAAPEGFDVTRFEFMNGRAASKDLLSDTTDAAGVRDLWYRIQANLYWEPRFSLYPFDRQQIVLQMEDGVHPAEELQYRLVTEGSGLDPSIRVAGWRIDGVESSVGEKTYAFGETYSRVTFAVHISREPLSALLRSFLPPLAFMVVSGLSFLLHPSKVAQRIALGTSMLISAVGFHVAQTVSLPTLGRLTLFDEVMLSTYAFLAASLVVTTVIAYNEDFRKDAERSWRLNVRGGWLALALPLFVFLALQLL
jgi:hypothetical protein